MMCRARRSYRRRPRRRLVRAAVRMRTNIRQWPNRSRARQSAQKIWISSRVPPDVSSNRNRSTPRNPGGRYLRWLTTRSDSGAARGRQSAVIACGTVALASAGNAAALVSPRPCTFAREKEGSPCARHLVRGRARKGAANETSLPRPSVAPDSRVAVTPRPQSLVLESQWRFARPPLLLLESPQPFGKRSSAPATAGGAPGTSPEAVACRRFGPGIPRPASPAPPALQGRATTRDRRSHRRAAAEVAARNRGCRRGTRVARGSDRDARTTGESSGARRGRFARGSGIT